MPAAATPGRAIRLGAFAKTFPGSDPSAVLAAVSAAGFDSAQYNLACSGLPSLPDAIPDAAAHAVRTAADATGIALCAVSGTYNMAHPDPAVRAEGLRRLEELAGACAAMGTPVITLCTGTRDPDDQWRFHADNATREAWADMREEVTRAAAIAERYGLRLGVEPELANVVDCAGKARRLLDEIGSPALGIVLDLANLFERTTIEEQRQIVADAAERLAGRILMGHAKDRDEAGRFVAAGKGVLDYPHYLNCLCNAGFSGDLVAHGLDAAEAPGVAAYLRSLLA